MTIALESMALGMPEVEGHPNRAAFRGVLTVVDVPSQRPPSGSNGRRVVLTRGAAEAALPSLLGMALDYAPTFDRHDVRRKVGVITSAEVAGHNLEVGGYLYAKDFPEIVEEIGKFRRQRKAPSLEKKQGLAMQGAWRGERERLCASLFGAVERIRSLTASVRQAADNSSGLGMSFEVTNVSLADRRARVWTLIGVTFTGAAILRKDKAAFEDTWIELSR